MLVSVSELSARSEEALLRFGKEDRTDHERGQRSVRFTDRSKRVIDQNLAD